MSVPNMSLPSNNRPRLGRNFPEEDKETKLEDYRSSTGENSGDEDHGTSIETVKKEINARENVEKMEELMKTLGFPLDINVRFNDLMKDIKKNLKENQGTIMPPPNDTTAQKDHVQIISNAGFVFGATYNTGQSQNIYTACNNYDGKGRKKSG